MQNYLYLDLETIPAQRPDVLEEIRANIKPPGTIKKPESIAAWMENESANAVDEAYRKTGLDGAFGQICVAGFALDDGDARTIWADDWDRPGYEIDLLEDFYQALHEIIPANQERAITVVGHSVANFDIRFMIQRSIVNRVKPHRIIAAAAQAKPWDGTVFDTMTQWAGFGNRISLDKLCRALSVPTPKTGIDGSKVWDEVREGRIRDVVGYCGRDVNATREVHRRMTFQSAPQTFEDVEL